MQHRWLRRNREDRLPIPSYGASRRAAGPPLRTQAAAASAVVAAFLAIAAVPAATSASRAQAAPAHRAPMTGGVLLINGDRLTAAGPSAGGPAAGVVPATAGAGAGVTRTIGVGSKVYQIPQAAWPYLGHGLDPDLFQVSLLRAAERHGTLPVTISYRGRVPVLPGVRVYHAGGGTAHGYLTAAGARVFGAALTRQFAADQARGSFGHGGLFAHGLSIRLAGAPATAAGASPGLPLHILTVTGVSPAGTPDTGGEVGIFNADNYNRFPTLLEGTSNFYKGTAKFSVPAGHYWAVAFFDAKPSSHGPLPERTVFLSQFTVSGNTAVRLDARSASSQLTMVTPRPAIPWQQLLFLRRTAAAGPVESVSFGGIGSRLQFLVSPTRRKPTVGTQQMFVNDQLASPPDAAGTPYEYDLAYAGPRGVIAPQRYVVRGSGLATVHAHYYFGEKLSYVEARWGLFPIQPDIGNFYRGVTLPFQQTEYMTGNPDVLWFGQGGDQFDTIREFHAGEQVTENWGAGPLHPGYNVNLVGAAALSPAARVRVPSPSASRAGNTLRLDVAPFADSTPGHLGTGYLAAFFPAAGVRQNGYYEIDENGRKIASGNPVKDHRLLGGNGELDVHADLSPRPSVIRFVMDASRTAKLASLSTASHTVWTWRSVHEAGARLPAGWTCVPIRSAIYHVTRSCGVEPMMTLEYGVARLRLNETAAPGRQVLHFSVGHLQLAKAASISQAAMSVSFDGGKTWQQARVTGSGGRYTAVFNAPAGSTVALRTSATDTAGGSITETITGAYQIAH